MYIVFGGDFYYPSGGIFDFKGFFSTLENAKIGASLSDWGQVVEHSSMELVWEYQKGQEWIGGDET